MLASKVAGSNIQSDPISVTVIFWNNGTSLSTTFFRAFLIYNLKIVFSYNTKFVSEDMRTLECLF